jgi:hypothetical protein
MRPLIILLCLLCLANVYSQNILNMPEQSLVHALPVFTLPEALAGVFIRDDPIENSLTLPGDLLSEIIIEDHPGTLRFIMGKGEIGVELLISFLLSENKNADRVFTEVLAGFYISEAAIEGINHDIAFAQMCLETGFLRYGGLVSPEMNNFCGLGAIGPGIPGEWFPTVELGVRAHIQHLKAYATIEPLRGKLMDPRFHFVRRGSSPTIKDLAGSWAADKFYADKIEIILGRLYRYRDLHN